MEGSNVDGHLFIDSAIKNGAKNIFKKFNINIRTLQRSIQLLEKQGYIKRDRNKKDICAIDKVKVDTYLENIRQ